MFQLKYNVKLTAFIELMSFQSKQLTKLCVVVKGKICLVFDNVSLVNLAKPFC